MVRVFIERTLAADVDEDLYNSMRNMRREAIHMSGYVSGETLRDVVDRRHFVILSTWRSRADWETWAASETRRTIEEQIGKLLAGSEKVTVFEVA